MSILTFKDYLRIVEDTQADIAKLMSDISVIDTTISQRTAPLAANRTRLQKLLMMKQKQAETEAKRSGNKSNDQQPMQATQQATGGTSPGSGGGGTPGSQ